LAVEVVDEVDRLGGLTIPVDEVNSVTSATSLYVFGL
jgi:hypothetical protein